MDGYGKVDELPDSLTTGYDGIMIFHGNSARDHDTLGGLGLWSELKPGHGAGFKSDGITNTYSDKFGPELTLALKLRSLYPDRKIAFVKYSRGGTSIDTLAARPAGCWEPDFENGDGINQYDHFIKTMDMALAVSDINGDGHSDKLLPAGIFWMQGETDAALEVTAGLYEENLKKLIGKFRESLGDVPVIIGRISDGKNSSVENVWKFGEMVREGQLRFVESDSNAAMITSTDDYKYSDPYHFDTFGYIDMGVKFGESYYTLINK